MMPRVAELAVVSQPLLAKPLEVLLVVFEATRVLVVATVVAITVTIEPATAVEASIDDSEAERRGYLD